jgi:hypothetical protein
VFPPIGDKLANCHAPACHTVGAGHQVRSSWTRPLTFTSAGTATVHFLVNAPGLAAAFNDITASVAIPEVNYEGPGRPVLFAAYRIPSAEGYNWDANPAAETTIDSAVWEESLDNGDTASRSAIGFNSASQAHAAFLGFFAGAIIGVGGAMLVAGMQEVLERIVRHWER